MSEYTAENACECARHVQECKNDDDNANKFPHDTRAALAAEMLLCPRDSAEIIHDPVGLPDYDESDADENDTEEVTHRFFK